MDRFVVHEGPGVDATPATHVLVIGVGHYPHLHGGGAGPTDAADGMGQLTSPPLSARAAADLFKTLSHPHKPLGTLALLLSEPTPATYTSPGSVPVPVEEATADNVEAALRGWKDRGHTSVDNRLIFFFCGHGQSLGEDMVLLLRDFGADADNAYDGSLDLTRLRLGLERCNAREQVFFVDACRQYSEGMVATLGVHGRVPFQPIEPRTDLPTRQFPTYYSTLEGFTAGGDGAEPSYFTRALIKSFQGAGADNPEGDWRVNTIQLQSALDYYLRRALDGGFRRRQVPGNSNLTSFDLHHLAEPTVPVVVGCRPDLANLTATLTCSADDGTTHQRPPSGEDWDVDLPAREFVFEASFTDRAYQPTQHRRLIRPSYQRITLDVV